MSTINRCFRVLGWTGRNPAAAWSLIGLFCWWSGGASVCGADLEVSREAFLSGQYTNCIRLCEAGLRENEPGESWRLLLAEAFLTVGQYPEAQAVITAAVERYSSSLRGRWLGYRILRQCGQTTAADLMLDELVQVAGVRSRAYFDAANMVALGRAALIKGADPRLVLEKLFDPAKTSDPSCRDAYLAAGELALDKQDYELAARNFREGARRFPKDPDFCGGLARAYESSDRKEMGAALSLALELNPVHIPSLLLLADNALDAEDYAGAEKLLDKVLSVNPSHPDAWAYRAVLRNLAGDAAGEKDCRARALRYWANNPRVDYLIGAKLSRKYRFAESSVSQERALRLDANYGPAKIQWAQDLLRLGEESRGWSMVEEISQSDGYNVVAFNLATLKDTMAAFHTITNQDFVVRMGAREAPVYGQRVVDLLTRAKSALEAKYALKLEKPVVVEIFPESKDFAVRTFGMPSESSYLGVCFGSVITANSPATQAAHPMNWQSLLWHEFAHVITLHLTHNKMPRWLSEGISVYEEHQANPAWGQRMNARYRQLIVDGDTIPLGKLSGAFLSPKDLSALEFAYYESYLAIEFLVQRFGFAGLRGLLVELGQGATLEPAMEKCLRPMPQLEKDFAAFVRERALNIGKDLEWEKPPARFSATEGSASRQGGMLSRFSPAVDSAARQVWISEHPRNFWALTDQAKERIQEKQYEAALAPLRKLLEAYPENTGPDNPYVLLAEVYRALKDTDQERQILTRLAAMDADALEVYLRLMELGAAAQDWRAVRENAERYLAVNPLVAPPYRYLALATENLGQAAEAIQANRLLLAMDPPDPAETHYRLARLLFQTKDPGAKRQVLQALEEAPRFRDAHRLLLQINGAFSPTPSGGRP